MAKKVKKTEFAGTGCLLQGFGLLLLFFFPIGTIAGVGLLLYGSIKSTKLICGACGNRIEKTANLCPTCKAALE